MRNFLVIFTVLVLMLLNTACSQENLEDLIYGPPSDPRTHYGVDPEFIPFVNAYEAEVGFEVYGIPMNFVEQEAGTAGVCYIYSERGELWKEIQVSRKIWMHLSDAEKQALVFHELTHCVTEFMGHIDDVRDDGCPFSIMYPIIPPKSCLNTYEADYTFNLFN